MNPHPHLDGDALRRLRSGDLPREEARGWAEHLAGDCAECEAFLANDPADALDGRVDEALASLAPPRADDAGNDMEWARIQRRLRTAPARRPARRWAALAVAAVALLAGGVVFQVSRAPRDEWTGVKGRAPAGAVPARLRFAVAGADQVERGASGQVLPADASLLFRIEVGAPAHVALVRVAGGESEVVYRGRAERPGALDVTVNGRPAAYPLRGLSGAQRFILVAGTHPIEEQHLAEAARLLSGQAASRDPRSPELSIDVIEITVR